MNFIIVGPMAASEIFGITIINSLSLLTWLLHQLPGLVTNGKLNKNREVLKCAMSLAEQRKCGSQHPFVPAALFTRSSDFPCVSHLLLSLSIMSHILRCICVSRKGKNAIFASTYLYLMLQARTRRAAVISTVWSATTTARTRTRWGCTREPCIFIRLAM